MLDLARTRDCYYLYEDVYKRRDQISRKEYSKLLKKRARLENIRYRWAKRDEKKIKKAKESEKVKKKQRDAAVAERQKQKRKKA